MAMFDGFDKVSVGLVSIGVGSRSVGGHPEREHGSIHSCGIQCIV